MFSHPRQQAARSFIFPLKLQQGSAMDRPFVQKHGHCVPTSEGRWQSTMLIVRLLQVQLSQLHEHFPRETDTDLLALADDETCLLARRSSRFALRASRRWPASLIEQQNSANSRKLIIRI